MQAPELVEEAILKKLLKRTYNQNSWSIEHYTIPIEYIVIIIVISGLLYIKWCDNKSKQTMQNTSIKVNKKEKKGYGYVADYYKSIPRVMPVPAHNY